MFEIDEESPDSHGLLMVEGRARLVLKHLPGAEVSRTRDAVQIDWGGTEGIVVLVTPEALELRLPTVEWTCGSYGPAASSRLWRRVEWAAIGDGRLSALLRNCKRARARQFRRCKYCGERVPPEHRVSADVCHGCASRHEGVVF
jgi:hypothetical protein